MRIDIITKIKMKKIVKRASLILLLFFCFTSKNVYAKDIELKGNGTFQDPYLIATVDDLKYLSEVVNKGDDLKNSYFKQIKNIDLNKQVWTPIGNKNNIFSGIYDGNGYSIENIYTDENEEKAGFFGNLAGTVVNLGIKSGEINGKYSGAIASYAVNEKAKIINCYSNVKVKGERAGGIADCFATGTIANCWSTGELEGDSIGGIVASGGDVKIYNCYTFCDILAPSDVYSSTSYCVNEDYLFTKKFSVKFSFFSAVSQYLFLDNPDMNLLQWKKVDGQLEFDQTSQYFSQIVGFINYWLLTLILILGGILFIVVSRKEGIINYVNNHKNNMLAGIAVGSIIAIFVDTALITKQGNNIHFGNGIFIFLINIFVCGMAITLLICYKKEGKIYAFEKKWIPLLILILLVVFLELMQFDTVPKYDASLYYGSFLKGAKLFRLDLLSYIGAFVCWKWAQGLALFMGPFEFLFPGESVSIYLANLVITVITLICLYWLLEQLYSDIPNWMNVLTCAIFMFSPYVLGLYTYMCMDWQLAFFTIWLLCAIKKNNNIMISFCGFLLAFTKITGIIVYVIILFAYVVIEILTKSKRGTLKTNIMQWWQWKKVILWIFPAILFAITLRWGDHLTIQNFYGSYVSDGMLEFGNKTRIFNNLIQTYVFGFRWIFTILLLISLFKLVKNRCNMCSMTVESRNLLMALCIAFMGVTVLLCIYNGDAECPRYTAIFSAFFAIMLPFEIFNLFKKKIVKEILYVVITLILVVQTFWTIDPSIIVYAQSIDTGKKQIYRLGINNDDRFGMNLGKDYGLGFPIMCDLYSYNLEYSFYDNLLEKAFSKVKLKNNDKIYVLDVFEYELHIAGSANRNYKIYWNTDTGKRTYNNEGNLYLDVQSITTDNIINNEVEFPEKFYIISVARVNDDKALNYFLSKGYRIKKQVDSENLYGSMTMYEIENGNKL